MSDTQRQTHHFTIIMKHFILKCRHGAGEVGDQLPKPEHLGPGKVVDNVQCSYPAHERLVAINGGKVWAMHQAVESFTDQLFVCVCVCVCVGSCMNGELSTLRSKTFSDVLTSAVIKEKHNW